MKKTVYHGSDHIIERPKYGYGKIYEWKRKEVLMTAKRKKASFDRWSK